MQCDVSHFYLMKTKVTILSAANLISPNGNSHINPMIRVLGHSVEEYLIGETNYVNDTNNPKFNVTFTFDFFRASYLDFCVYNHNSFSPSELIGIARIRASDIIPTQIMKIPIDCIRSGSIVSDLSVCFSFDFSGAKKGSFGIFKSQIFLYTTYQAISTDTNPVDIDCLIVDHKWKMFYVLNAGNWWTTVGRSSNQETVPIGNGHSQLRKLDLKKLKGCEVHFYIKSNTFDGKLFLNFGCISKEGSSKIKDCERHLTLFKQIEFDVKPGYVYSSTEKMITKPLGRIEFTYEDSSDYNSLVNYLVNGLKMKQRLMLPHNCSTSLAGCKNLAIVFGGAAYTENNYSEIEPKLYVFEKETNSYIGSLRNKNTNSCIEESMICLENRCNKYISSNNENNTKYTDKSCISIHFDQIQDKFMLIIGVKISGFYLYDIYHPMIRFVDADSNKELFFLPYKPSIYNASGELLFSIIYQKDSWVIVPIFYPVIDPNQLRRASADYIAQGCPPYNEFDFKVKPLTQGISYQIEMQNQIDTY